MKTQKKPKYTEKRIGKIRIVPDFLPTPEKLVMKEKNVKVTLSLTQESLDFFKNMAKLNHTQYQKMIRNLLHQYSTHYK